MPMTGLARSISSKPDALNQARRVNPQLRASRAPRVLRAKESVMIGLDDNGYVNRPAAPSSEVGRGIETIPRGVRKGKHKANRPCKGCNDIHGELVGPGSRPPPGAPRPQRSGEAEWGGSWGCPGAGRSWEEKSRRPSGPG